MQNTETETKCPCCEKKVKKNGNDPFCPFCGMIIDSFLKKRDPPIVPKSARKKLFMCPICKGEFKTSKRGEFNCPNCGTHLARDGKKVIVSCQKTEKRRCVSCPRCHHLFRTKRLDPTCEICGNKFKIRFKGKTPNLRVLAIY
ncbi:MAG: hypothetical protein ABH800_00340 [Candidatus Nealsonbacteria bacterium]